MGSLPPHRRSRRSSPAVPAIPNNGLTEPHRFELFLCRAVGDALGVAACSNHRLDLDYHTRPADLIPLDEV